MKARKSSPPTHASRIRLGLCCQFAEQPIRFRTTTATNLMRLKPAERRRKLSHICLGNAESLLRALQYCALHGIGCFRITSTILPVKTHPQAGYSIESLPESPAIVRAFEQCGRFAAEHRIRTVFHPDQFVVLNSPRADVVAKAIADLEYHAEIAEWVGADVINIHGGGGYGDKPAALVRFAKNFRRLPRSVRSRLTIENDDKVFTPSDLIPVCQSVQIPLVYDVHHHRCLPDGLSVERATEAALQTWDREPLFHISSPKNGWNGRQPHRHHDYIDIGDVPTCWRNLTMTVEVEAKSKELAIRRLQTQLAAKFRTRGANRLRQGAGGLE